jgi:hypothetical protein
VHFTFYRGSTGAKALEEMPQVMGEVTTQFMKPQMQDLEQKLNEAFNKVLRERGYKQ